MSRTKANVLLLLVAIFWGTTFVASKIALNTFSPLFIISIRFILALVFMGVLFHKDLASINKHDIVGGAVVGLVLFVAFFMQLFALNYTDPGKQSFLAGTYVIFVPFMMWMITRKRPSNHSFLGAFMCFVGISLLTLNQAFSMSLGDSITIASSVFFALHIITTDYFLKKSSPSKLTFIQFATVAILSTVALFATESLPTSFSMTSLLPMLYLGIVCTGLAYFLQTYAQQFAKSTHTAIILSLEAVFGSLLAIVIVGEVFTPKMILGSLIILASILIVEIKSGKEASEVDNKEEIAS